jgi:hypothetical protein
LVKSESIGDLVVVVRNGGHGEYGKADCLVISQCEVGDTESRRFFGERRGGDGHIGNVVRLGDEMIDTGCQSVYLGLFDQIGVASPGTGQLQQEGAPSWFADGIRCEAGDI